VKDITMDTFYVVFAIVLIVGLSIWNLSIRFRIIKLLIKIFRK